MQGHVNNEPYLQVPSGHYNVSWHSIDWHGQCVDNQLSPEVIAIHAVLVHKSHVWADTIFLMTRLKPATFGCESHFLSVRYFHNACQLGLSQQPFKPSLLKKHTHTLKDSHLPVKEKTIIMYHMMKTYKRLKRMFISIRQYKTCAKF